MKRADSRPSNKNPNNRVSKPTRSRSVYTIQDEVSSFEKLMLQLHSPTKPRKAGNMSGLSRNLTLTEIIRQSANVRPIDELIDLKKRSHSADVHKSRSTTNPSSNRNENKSVPNSQKSNAAIKRSASMAAASNTSAMPIAPGNRSSSMSIQSNRDKSNVNSSSRSKSNIPSNRNSSVPAVSRGTLNAPEMPHNGASSSISENVRTALLAFPTQNNLKNNLVAPKNNSKAVMRPNATGRLFQKVTARAAARMHSHNNVCDPTNVECHLHYSTEENINLFPNKHLLNETQRLFLGCLPRGTKVTLLAGAMENVSARSSETIIGDDPPIDWDALKKKGPKLSFQESTSLEYYQKQIRRQMQKRETVEEKRLRRIAELKRKVKETEDKIRFKERMRRKQMRETMVKRNRNEKQAKGETLANALREKFTLRINENVQRRTKQLKIKSVAIDRDDREKYKILKTGMYFNKL